MLNPQIISENIVYLRQRMGLTQQELAAKANVTHQAVSKWENGSSIPDLQTLLTLSRLFGVTLDELLTEVLDARQPAVEPSRDAQATPQSEPPIDKAADEAGESASQADSARPVVALHDLIGLAPFLPKGRLSALVMEQADSVTPESLVPLAPFLGRRELDEITARMDFSSVTPGRVLALAPFLSRETLEDIVKRMDPKSLTPGQLAGLAPFLDGNALGSLVSRIGQLPMKALSMLAPFLSRDTLDAQVAVHVNRAAEKQQEGQAHPAGKADGVQARLALRLAEKGDFDELADIFPMLDEETRGKIIDMALDADDLDFLDRQGGINALSGELRRRVALRRAENGDFDELADIFPTLDEETRGKIIDMALDADDLDFLDRQGGFIPDEMKPGVARRMAENGDFDELASLLPLTTLDDDTLDNLEELALEQDETDFLRKLRRMRGASRRDKTDDAPHTVPEVKAADKALNMARRGDFSAVPQLLDRMSDAQKDEVVRLAIVFDNTDFLVDCVEDLPQESLETLCFSLARMGEVRRLASFQGYLPPETRLRIERIVTLTKEPKG